jgi:hypothetical protein
VAPALAPAAPVPPPGSLFEIDAPVGPLSNANAQPARAPAAIAPMPAGAVGGNRSTMEFLSELEEPAAQESTATIDFDATAAAEAEAELGLEPPAAFSFAEPVEPATPAVEAAEPITDDGTAAAAAEVAAAARASLPDLSLIHLEPNAGHMHRVVLRIAACRDSMRVMANLDVPEAERAAAARLLMALEDVIPRAEGAPSVVKEPDAVLKNATPEQLTALEAAVSAIEDKLLWLDESVSPALFRARIDSGKQSKKLLGRYARLLASRRFMAGQRRDRFEWIAARLLVMTDAQGVQQVLPPDRARSVLQYVLSDLPRKAKADELAEAIVYLQDAFVRLASIGSYEEFLDGGFHLDVHGYKVSMRELLVAPEFVYLSVFVGAAVHNRLERWIEDRDRLMRANIAVQSSVREDIERQLREQEDAVDDIFSVKRKSGLVSTTLPEAKTDETAAPKKSKRKAAKKSGLQFELPVIDRQLGLQVLMLVAIIASIATVLVQTKVVGTPTYRALKDNETAELSPLLAGASITGSGDAARLDAMIRADKWQPLDPRARMAAVEELAAKLAGRKIKNGVISTRKGHKIAEIRDGLATYVEGGKL